jgi:hypothetical protein
MCIICVKPAGVDIKKAVLKTCFENNPHGAGIALPSIDNKKVIVEKGFFSFNHFWQRYKFYSTFNKSMLIHFRVATSGKIDKKNCHPWVIDSAHAFVHNGNVQKQIGLQDDDYSDTALFVKHILKPTFAHNKTVWKNSAYKWCIETTIGKNNKMVILDNNGEFVIFNEKEGIWEDGIWFSNDTFKTARKSLAKLGSEWIEWEGGVKYAVKKKNGVTTKIRIANPLEAAPTCCTTEKKVSDDSVFKFVSNQLGGEGRDDLTRNLSREEVDLTYLY